MGRIRASYTAKEKLAAITYAEAHGNRAAGRQFSTNEKNVREWRRQKEALQRVSKTRRANRGRSAQYPEVEKTLLQWVTERRDRCIGVSTVLLHEEALKLARGNQAMKSFTASQSWVYTFMKRNNLSVRRRTHIAQKLPGDFDTQLTQFQRYIIDQRKTHDFDLSQIGNADQTPLTFDLPSNTTVNVKGASTVTINTTGNEKNRFTVMLACTADGGKLPPYIVFKRKTLPKKTIWPKGIVVRCQAKGWMDNALVHDWIDTVWAKRPGGLLKKKSLLMLDAFRAHRSDDVKAKLSRKKTALAIIPGGMTSILQPLDVSVNKPMKVLLQRRWSNWYADGTHSFTAGGNMRKPELVEICSWIVDAWEELDPEIIIKAFKKCCISNAIDGTEDDTIWEDLVQSSPQTTELDIADDDHVESYYADHATELTDQQLQTFFETDSEESDFEGFDESDISTRD